MDSKKPAYNKDEILLRKIFDLINENINNKKISQKIFYIHSEAYKNIKIHFNPVNKYKAKARNLIRKITI